MPLERLAGSRRNTRSRYIQADAHAIDAALFRGTPPRGAAADGERGSPPAEVGCWSHRRTNIWEAAVGKHELGGEGLRRINAIFVAARALADLPPAQRKVRCDAVVRPLADAFFAWVKAAHARPRERGLVSAALGYALNQEQPRFVRHGGSWVSTKRRFRVCFFNLIRHDSHSPELVRAIAAPV